eukprot:TRINITY_DN15838_c0_g1_i1.p1 TRINITY_DN15838_c0_g1~~TRINITY_DN15838_c0_g1_i1.p1  ORF type:complete len:231 (+),score=38.29 TRINITY_DN15838_c0_g1_i1:100-792(+)
MSISGTSNSWEDLRMKARKLEREVDLKLSALDKVKRTPDIIAPADSQEAVPLLREFATVDGDISTVETFLRELADIHDQMAKCEGGAERMAMQHTLQRHREVLHSYRSDIRDVKKAVSMARERAELLSGVRVDSDASRADILLRERAALHSSDKGLDTVLGQATAAFSALTNQRMTLLGTGTNLVTMAQRLPLVGGLINRIGRRRARDNIILAVIIGVCLALLIVFLMRK